MKKNILVTPALLGLFAASAFAATPLLDYNFNANSTTQNSAGSLSDSITIETPAVLGADGSGVSGLSGDRAFSNVAASAMGSSATSNVSGVATNSTTSIGGLTSLTVAGWFKADEILANGAFLLNSDRFSLRGATDGTTGTLMLSVGGTNASRSTSVVANTRYDDVGTWVFFAVTWNGSTVTYYDGTKTATVGTVSSTAFSPTMGVVSTNGLNIGNVSSGATGSATRVFDGLLDNIRVFDSALSSSDLETLRLNDLSNISGIPEPSVSTALMGAGALAAGAMLRRQRR